MFTDKNAGFSLVELMVALAVGMVVILIVGQFFSSTRSSYMQSDAMSRVQENARFSMDVLATDIRMAGFMGCMQDVPVNNIALPSGNDFFTFSKAVQGFTQGSGSAPGGIPNAPAWTEVKAGTSVLSLKRGDSTATRLDGNLDPNNANLQIKGNPAAIQDDEILMISDCTHADVFRVNNVSQNGVVVPTTTSVTISHSSAKNTDPKLSTAYQSGSELMRLVSRIYYIGSGTGTCPANTLCRVNLTVSAGNPIGRVESLISNVEDMDLLYGLDSTGDKVADRFFATADITDAQWATVVSVQINLLLRSENDKVTVGKQGSYWYNGSTQTPTSASDRYLRRSFTQLVTLRNRTP